MSDFWKKLEALCGLFSIYKSSLNNCFIKVHFPYPLKVKIPHISYLVELTMKNSLLKLAKNLLCRKPFKSKFMDFTREF